MKKLFGIAVALMSTIVFFSCEPAEQEFRYDYYFDNIYTVNKQKLRPEFEDSLITITNMEQFGLVTGQRARMVLHYFYDYSTMRYPKCEINDVVEVIPTLSLSVMDSVAVAEYATPFVKLHYYELMDRYCHPVWIWDNKQNLNISFKGIKDNANFAMSVRGVSGDSIEFDLYAKAEKAGNVTSTKLLTFDLSDVDDFLTEEQKKSIAGKDSLWTRIYFKREEDNAVKEVNILGGKFANPVK